MIEANRGFVLLDRHQPWSAPSTYTDSTAGWYWTIYAPWLPLSVYVEAQVGRKVDAVYGDAGIVWPSSTPSSQ